MFKVNNKDTRTTPWRRSGIFIVNFEHISHLVLVFLLLTLSRKIAGWVVPFLEEPLLALLLVFKAKPLRKTVFLC